MWGKFTRVVLPIVYGFLIGVLSIFLFFSYMRSLGNLNVNQKFPTSLIWLNLVTIVCSAQIMLIHHIFKKKFTPVWDREDLIWVFLSITSFIIGFTFGLPLSLKQKTGELLPFKTLHSVFLYGLLFGLLMLASREISAVMVTMFIPAVLSSCFVTRNVQSRLRRILFVLVLTFLLVVPQIFITGFMALGD